MKSFQILCFSIFFSFSFSIFSQSKEITIKTTKLTENVYMLEGQGGNIGVSVGDDGVLMIDSQFGRLTPKILDAIKQLSDKDITFLGNTHHHGDHTGGNANISKLGTHILAHDNVYKRIKANERQSEDYLPVITFNDKMNIHFNGDTILVFHVENAHTNGDALYYFTESNVLHTGDTYFNGRYPYIDLISGGSVEGYINAIKRTLIVIDDDTKIIPGHGVLSNKKEYLAFLDMMENLRQNVQTEISSGKTEEEIIANESLTKTYDDLDYDCCFISSERIRKIFYTSLKQE
ncbi:MBL fold metallo-hydrolase [Seonamhaeicola maritimus]|uniref:MBL fold metallo-hydrolase n=1 Tax=Seonamhaeicola maritimus TaxID=2591822 RepID=A0A5C7GIT5_9FLAO|nr:MBL fold metallo-hydrolase [Seonamhaeicola maritimus]TXG37494.1 MBL fold metallo-hydrolase [Seonamhaeicola maritimus]